MVTVVTGEVCVYKYCGVYDVSFAVCYNYRVICFICSLILMIYSLVQYFTGSAVEGYTTLLMVLLLIGSAMMISLGIIGYYISKIYEEVKRRPRYIISKVIKNGENQK